jgi:hypothetical protein
VLDIFWQHTIRVKRYQGSGAKGDVFADEVELKGLVEDANTLVTNAQGEQVNSSARVFLPADTAPIPLDSEVTLTGPCLGRTTRVIGVNVHDAGGLPTPDHVEVVLL